MSLKKARYETLAPPPWAAEPAMQCGNAVPSWCPPSDLVYHLPEFSKSTALYWSD